jgi:hypothetical protein
MEIRIKILIVAFFLSAIVSSCIPDSVKEKVNESMASAQSLLADQEFKKAIAHIELHKLRNGAYPESLKDLDFLNAMDSSMFAYVEYTRLDSVYELNIKMVSVSFDDNKNAKEVQLKYPLEFWNGLGCVRSNVKESW